MLVRRENESFKSEHFSFSSTLLSSSFPHLLHLPPPSTTNTYIHHVSRTYRKAQHRRHHPSLRVCAILIPHSLSPLNVIGPDRVPRFLVTDAPTLPSFFIFSSDPLPDHFIRHPLAEGECAVTIRQNILIFTQTPITILLLHL